MTHTLRLRATAIAIALLPLTLLAAPADQAAPTAERGPSLETARVIAHWTPERRAAAIPRDLVIDERGQGYLRLPNGRLQPYGRPVADIDLQTPMAKPGGGGDTTPPTVTNMDPANKTIGAAYPFSAKVTDISGVRSVKFSVRKGTARPQSFSASDADDDTVWTAQLSGLTDGGWSWQVIAKDKAGNTRTTDPVAFTVSAGTGGPVITNEVWTTPGALQTAAGRLYFQMPDNAARTVWVGYVCSGTAVTDSTQNRSIILTAAHCVYDDANKAFARNVMFIPNQDETTGTRTDLDCTNDPLGCWTPSFGAVDVNWTARVFPDNIAWDYAYYVVNDTGSHAGTATTSDALDVAAGSVRITFDAPVVGGYTHALGYSYSEDPKFMYCAENMATTGTVNWWLGSCRLSGGSSGGPWIQNMAGGTGDVISVNSWGYTNWPGMAGPKLSGTSASCVFGQATSYAMFEAGDGDSGIKVSCP